MSNNIELIEELSVCTTVSFKQLMWHLKESGKFNPQSLDELNKISKVFFKYINSHVAYLKNEEENKKENLKSIDESQENVV
jgi:hypothetical protein